MDPYLIRKIANNIYSTLDEQSSYMGGPIERAVFSVAKAICAGISNGITEDIKERLTAVESIRKLESKLYKFEEDHL